MEWFEAIVGALGGGIITFVSTILYFRPKLKEAKAEANKAETEASAAEYAHLLERIHTMEELYKKQGETIDELREKLLKLGEEKLDRELEVAELKIANETLTKRVSVLEKELEAYKIIVDKK